MFIKPKWYNTFKFRYALYGIFFGLCFPILAVSIDLFRLNLDLSWANIQHIHSIFPVHFIVETAPLVLGFMAFFSGNSLDRIKEKNAQIMETSNYKDNFLASMSHEIRTPMAGIVGVVDLLSKNNNLNNQDKEYLNIVKTSASDLMRIINDILDLSKLRAGKLLIEKNPINVREACMDLKNLFLALSRSKNLGLNLEIAEDVPLFLNLDAIRIKQVLTNLIGNALKFSKKGTVTLKISSQNRVDNTATLKFEVIDEGIGIQKDELDKIFMAYRQIEDYSKKHINGTGLGLFICKRLVQLMSGEMGVESEYKKGSNFWFTIEADIVKNTAMIITRPKIKLASTETENMDLHVLLVDDNKTLCTVFGGMLKKTGCQTVVAHNGQELIGIFKEGVYDIILLDINMPVMGGLEAMEYLRANFKNVPPIIGASASALKGDIDRYMALGFDDYLTKPFTTAQLQAKLFKWKPKKEPFNEVKLLKV